nr:hypothetical protein [Tanacetum cinerariifolium]
MEIVIPEVGGIDEDILLTIKNDILREKLLNINLLIANIEALKDNPTPYSDFVAKSSSTSFNFLLEETNTFDNSLPESETFCFNKKEISSGSTTTRSDYSLSDYEAFYDDHIKKISSGKFKERMRKYTGFDAQSFNDAMIYNMDSIWKYMLEIIVHQQRTPQLLKQKKLIQTQDHSNPIQALNVNSLKVDLVVIQNTYSEKEDSNSETASNKSIKECSLDSATNIVHAIKYKIQITDKYFAEYTRIEVTQFRETLLQHMSNVKKSVAQHVIKEKSSGIESEVQDNNRRSGNDTDADDAYIRPIYDEEPMAEEKVFAIAALKNDLRKLKGNIVDTKFAQISVFGKLVLQSLRNQSVVRQPNAFKSKRPQMSKPRFASQVDVNNNLSRPVTQHYLPKKRESIFAKTDHMIASSESRDSSKNMPRFSSNDMIHNHYLDEARKKIQEKDRNSKTSVMHTEVNSRAKIQSHKTINRNKPVDQKSYTHISVRQIFTGHRFSPNKTFAVYEKTSPRSDLRWKPTEVPSKDTIVMTSMIELESLFGPFFDEYFNGENQVVSKSSAGTIADASIKRQQQQDSTSSTSTLPITFTADEHFDL